MQDPRPEGRVLRPDALPTYERGGGARTTPLVGPSLGASFLNGITRFEPSASIPLHTHNCEESVVLLEGEAIAEVAGVRHLMKPLDASWIPEGVPHRFINASDTLGMTILWTYTRIDATRTLVETGETRPVAAEHDATRIAEPAGLHHRGARP